MEPELFDEEMERQKLIGQILEGLRHENLEFLRKSKFLLSEIKSNIGLRKIFEESENILDFLRRASKNVSTTGEPELAPTAALFSPGSRLDVETHPMENDYILRRFFKLASVDLLKKYRLVCRKWLNLSLDSWRERAVLGLNFEVSESHLYPVTGSLGYGLHISEFFEIVRREDECSFHRFTKKPFKSYQWNCEETNLYDPEVTADFLECIDLITSPGNVTYLKISHFDGDYDLWIQILMKFINLKDLKIYRSSIFNPIGSPVSELTGKLMKSLLTLQVQNSLFWGGRNPLSIAPNFIMRFPRLIAVTVGYIEMAEYPEYNTHNNFDHYEAGRSIISMLEGIKSLRGSGDFDLKKLEIMNEYNQYTANLCYEMVRVIQSCSFPLTRLAFDIGLNSDLLQSLHPLLEAHSTTLQYFKVGHEETYCFECHSIYASSDETIMPLIKLEKLEQLVFEVKPSFGWPYRVLRSLQVPKLKKLSIYFKHSANYSQRRTCRHQNYYSSSRILYDSRRKLDPRQDLLKGIYLPQVTHFTSKHTSGFDKSFYFECEVEDLVRSFPNLTHLKIPSSTSFNEVCKFWPTLQFFRAFDEYDYEGVECIPEDENIHIRPLYV